MASRLAQATCGVMMKFGSRKSSRILPCLGGSTVKTSKPAPPMSFVGQRLGQGGFIDEAAAAGVDQNGVVFHQFQLARA